MPLPPTPWRLSVAPMMDWTDRHCRVFHRLITRRTRLYTEMVTTGALLHGDSRPLVMGQPLTGLRPDDPPDTTKPPVPVAWTKTFTGTSGKPARVFTTTYGYGERRERNRCNENHRWHPVVQLFRATSQALWGHVQMNDPQINQLPGTVALTGAHSGCSNEYGVYDMVGNLHEWIDDPNGTFKGGFYADAEINGRGCLYTTTAHNFDYRDYSTGFRCCADPR